jgi:hypothetical protein
MLFVMAPPATRSSTSLKRERSWCSPKRALASEHSTAANSVDINYFRPVVTIDNIEHQF